MYDELKKKLPAYMTDAQRAAWEKYEASHAAIEPPVEGSENRTERAEKRPAEGEFNRFV